MRVSWKDTKRVLFFDMVKNHVSSIGDMFVLVEPDPVSSYLGRSLAHVTCKNRIILLLYDPTLLPNIEINPGEVGDIRYFCKKHQNIEFSQARTCSNDVSCNGTLCDRQKCSNTNKKYGCFQKDETHPFILEMDVIIDCPLSVGPTGTYILNHFCSWRTTKLFFRNPLQIAQLAEKEQHEKQSMIWVAVDNMKNFVNTHEGWTIVGRFQQGEVSDETTSN